MTYDDVVLNIVETPKHLGICLSANNKWTKHIDSIIMSASKQVSYLRKLKYKLSKNTLNKLYSTYIGPLLEYGSEVWDGCSIDDNNRLEEIQLNAAGFQFLLLLALYTLKLDGKIWRTEDKSES